MPRGTQLWKQAFALTHACLIPRACFKFSFLEYGSMLSCASSDGRFTATSRSNQDTPNEVSHRIGHGALDGEAVSENAALARYAVGLDADMHWEMNYHEAAIFLEVNRLASTDRRTDGLIIVRF